MKRATTVTHLNNRLAIAGSDYRVRTGHRVFFGDLYPTYTVKNGPKAEAVFYDFSDAEAYTDLQTAYTF